MCGIFAVLQKISSFNSYISKSIISKEFMKGQSRGPENSVLKEINPNLLETFAKTLENLQEGKQIIEDRIADI